MKEVCQKIINLCENLHTGESKLSVNNHNKAMEKLFLLYNDLEQDKEDACDVFSELIEHDDDRVKLIAAACCISLNSNVVVAKKTLKRICKTNENPSISLEAEMILELWKENGFFKFA